MTDHPVLLPTSKGPVGGVVSEPEGTARAALILLQGGGPPVRCGINALWTRIARNLASEGVVVLRFDFACEGDSAMIGVDAPREPAWKSAVNLPITREVSAWFRERAGMEILLAGSCYGARLALELAAEDRRVEGVFLITPYLAGVRRKGGKPSAPNEALADLPRVSESHSDRLGALAVDSSRGIIERGRPLWILTGEADGPHSLELRERVGEIGGRSVEVEVAPGMALHPGADPAAQELIAQRLVERIVAELSEPAAGL